MTLIVKCSDPESRFGETAVICHLQFEINFERR